MAGGAEGARKALAGALAILACAVLVFVPVTWWIDQRLTQTDGWVSLVEPLPRDPGVQDAIAGELAEVLLDGLNVTGVKRDAAEPIARETAASFIGSDAFTAVWTRANTVAHQSLIAELRNEGRRDQEPRLQLITAAAVLLNRLEQPLSRVVELPAAVPDVPADPTADEARAALDAAFGRRLPRDRAAIELVPADQIDRARAVYRVVDGSAVWAGAMAAGLLIGAVLASTDRWGLVARVGFVVAIGCLAVWLAAATLLPLAARTLASRAVTQDVSGAAAERAAADLGHVLVAAAILAAVIAVVALVGRSVTRRST
jgi:hypothetical protein